jgi:hypothetical protein
MSVGFEMQTDFTPLNLIAPPRRSLVDRLEDWLWRQHRRDIEAYLATSQNLFELEERIRDLGHAPTNLCQFETPDESSGPPSIGSVLRQ